MKVSRHFLIVVSSLLIIAFGVYYFFTKASFFDRVSAENLSTLDTFLLNNYSLQLHLDKSVENAIGVYCDPTVALATPEAQKIAYPCQNENPVHKVVIGWAGSEYDYMTVLKAQANEQLYWRNYASTEVEDGSLSCKERPDYRNYRNALFGMDCILTTNAGDKLYSSTMFFKGATKDVQTFVTVMNTVRSSSARQVELELLALLSHDKEPDTKYRFDNLFPFLNSAPEKDTTIVLVSGSLSTESSVPSRSNSANSITKNSGSGIDATVCDAVDTTNCYPLYCESLTAVWNYSLNKCVEPQNPLPLDALTHCTGDLPVWDGSKCRPLNGDIISNDTCAIASGKSSCTMTIFWSVHAPKKTIEVRRKISSTESIVIGKGSKDSISYTFSYQPEPYIVELYDGNEKINEGVFTTTCLDGGWDTETNHCVSPSVKEAKVSGEYYKTPGSILLTCSNAKKYSATYSDKNIVIASGTYSGTVDVPVEKSGNYSLTCSSGNYTGDPVVRYYNAPPPPAPEIYFLISPRTVSRNEKLILNWNIHFPRESCSLHASVVCKNGTCNPDQTDFENEINQTLQADTTDADDSEGTRLIANAINTVAPKHIDGDWRAIGQKTLSIRYTTDFTLDCGGGLLDKKRVYLRTAQ